MFGFWKTASVRMKNFWSRFKSSPSLALMSIGTSMIVFSSSAHAEDKLSDAMKGWASEIESFQLLFLYACYVIGVILCGSGIYLIYKDSKEEGRNHMRNGLVAFFVGILLVILPRVIGWSVNSAGGSASDITNDIDNAF